MEGAIKRQGFIVQFLMGLIITSGIIFLAGSIADQMYLKNSYFEAKNLTDKAALSAAKKYQETSDETIAINSARNISMNNKIFGEDLSGQLVFTFNATHTMVTATLPHYQFKTFWLKALNLQYLNLDNIHSTAALYTPINEGDITPFIINNKDVQPGDSLSLTFNNAGVKGQDYNPNDTTAFYPLELGRTTYYNLDGTAASQPCNGSVEKVLKYADNIIFGSENSVSNGDIAFLENDNNPAFGNVSSILNSLSNGFPSFFNNDTIYAATFVALATLKLRYADITSTSDISTNLNSILSNLNAKNDWPLSYTTIPVDSKPEIYIAVSNGSKATDSQNTTTIIQDIIKVRLDALIVNKPDNKNSSTATLQASFTVLPTPPKLIE